jgi:ubiquinone/menaquinone biosynthesis C-methylase UbiE
MVPQTGGWEEDYSRRGILWSGVTDDLPELPLGSQVLELGCGNGKSLSAMIHRGWDVTAIDSSPRAVSLSRERCKGASSCEFIVADARFLPFKSNSFDTVFTIHILGHIDEHDRNLMPGKLAHSLKPGGILFFSDFSTDDFRFGSGFEKETATFQRGTGIFTHYFSRQEVIELFSGLTPVFIRIHQWPMRVRGKNLVRSEIKGVFVK